MAGHSAWANIKHRKARQDAVRGRVWSKCARAIMVAARHGGGDPAFNTTLRYAVDEAKAANMPKDTIEKAIRKGTGELQGASYDPVRFEGYAAGGVAVLVDCLTDNVNRTAPEIRSIFDRHGGNLGKPGAVSYGFTQRGLILIEESKTTEDALLEAALDAGIENVAAVDGAWEVTCAPAGLHAVREAIGAAGIEPDSAEVTMVPNATVALDAETAAKVLRLIEALEENDDTQKVYHNAEIPEEVLEGA